jgi:hypothetical protein
MILFTAVHLPSSVTYPEQEKYDAADNAKNSILIAASANVVHYISPIVHNAQIGM